MKIDGGSARVLISAFKAFAQTENQSLMPQLSVWTRELLGSIDSERLTDFHETDTIKLLCAVTRLDRHFLSIIVDEDGSKLVKRGWMVAIVKAIKQVQQSELLKKILASDWCTPEVESVILEVRGA
jgi:hypothetical protein